MEYLGLYVMILLSAGFDAYAKGTYDVNYIPNVFLLSIMNQIIDSFGGDNTESKQMQICIYTYACFACYDYQCPVIPS